MRDQLGCLQTNAFNAHEVLTTNARKDGEDIVSSASNIHEEVVSECELISGIVKTHASLVCLVSQMVRTKAKMVGSPLKTSASLVCPVSVGSSFEWFLVEEGVVIFVDGKEFMVKKNGVSKQI
jgi:hypothetical protein